MAYMVAMFVNRLGQNEQCEKDDGHLVMAKAHITIFVKMLLIDWIDDATQIWLICGFKLVVKQVMEWVLFSE